MKNVYLLGENPCFKLSLFEIIREHQRNTAQTELQSSHWIMTGVFIIHEYAHLQLHSLHTRYAQTIPHGDSNGSKGMLTLTYRSDSKVSFSLLM